MQDGAGCRYSSMSSAQEHTQTLAWLPVPMLPALPAGLQVMKKMKSGKSLDARQRMLLDDASYACIPPAHMTARVKARPPLQAYLRHLILERMWVDDPKKVVPV